MFVHVCVCMCTCMCASPPSREHGAVERMRNVGVEEVREDGRGTAGGRSAPGTPGFTAGFIAIVGWLASCADGDSWVPGTVDLPDAPLPGDLGTLQCPVKRSHHPYVACAG